MFGIGLSYHAGETRNEKATKHIYVSRPHNALFWGNCSNIFYYQLVN